MVDMIVIVQPEGFHIVFVSIALGFFPLLPKPAASNFTTVIGANSLKPDVKITTPNITKNFNDSVECQYHPN